MAAKVKLALKIAAILLAVLIGAITLLVFLVDANSFKPRLESLARNQGIALSMRGNLHWAYWPALGLAAEDVSVADVDMPQQAIADVKKASFLIAFMPLIKGDFQVKHILVDGAVINLEVDAQGRGNWEKLLHKKAPPPSDDPLDLNPVPAKNANAKQLKLAIETLSLHHSQISYTNLMENQHIQLNDITLDMDNVNTQGKPFAVSLALDSVLGEIKDAAAVQLAIKLHGQLSMTPDFSNFSLSQSRLTLDMNAQEKVSATLDINLGLEDLKRNPHYQGDIAIASINLRQWLQVLGKLPAMASEKALTDVRLTTDFSGDKKQIKLERVRLQLDKTTLSGSFSYTDFTDKQIKLTLGGDSLNLDDYLPPVTATTSANPASPAPAAARTPLPYSLLHKFDLSARLELQSLQLKQVQLQQPALQVNVDNGELQQDLSAKLYSGGLHQQAHLTAQGSRGNLDFEAHIMSLDVGALLKDRHLDKSLQITGKVQMDMEGTTQAMYAQELMDNLHATALFSGSQFRVAAINVEQQFCQLVHLANRENAPAQQWNNYTDLHDVSGKITLTNRMVTVENFVAGVQKLQLGANGKLDLRAGGYDFHLPLKLVRDENDTPTSITTSPQGCKVNSNYWVERGMSLLRCKGAYAAMSPASDCRPDKDQLGQLIKDLAEYRLKAQVDNKKSDLMKKLDDKLGALKNLFKK